MRTSDLPSDPSPLSPFLEAAGTADGVREWRLEYTSRGDRVPARLLLPEAPGGDRPVVVVAHGARGDKGAAYIDAACLPWARGGAAVVAIDLPLHGERRSPKLSERVLGSVLADHEASELEASLWSDLVVQAVGDLRRAIDAAGSHAEVDATRAGFVGFSLGAMIGTLCCAAEPRLGAAALALAGAGLGPAATDPGAFVGEIAPRPLLLVNAERDSVIPRTAAERLHAAAGEGSRVEWYDAPHDALPGVALKSIWGFLRASLPVPG